MNQDEQTWVHLAVADGVATLTLDRPPANAYDVRMHAVLQQRLRAVEESEARVVVLRSASARFFCAGADLGSYVTASTAEKIAVAEAARETSGLIDSSSRLYVAEISGHALGGGLELALACDVRFGAMGAYRLGLPEIRLGLIPGNGGTQRLARLIGSARAIEVLALGDPFGPQEAEAWGVLNRLFADAQQLRAGVAEFAARIAQGPPRALAATKRAVRDGAHLALPEALAVEARECRALYETQDAQEGLAAFRDKRAARFVGD